MGAGAMRKSPYAMQKGPPLITGGAGCRGVQGVPPGARPGCCNGAASRLWRGRPHGGCQRTVSAPGAASPCSCKAFPWVPHMAQRLVCQHGSVRGLGSTGVMIELHCPGLRCDLVNWRPGQLATWSPRSSELWSWTMILVLPRPLTLSRRQRRRWAM